MTPQTEKRNLSQYLLTYLNTNEGWHSKGSLYMVGEREEYSPESVGRELRDLAKAGLIKRDEYKGKRGQTLTNYANQETQKVVIPDIEIMEINGERIAVIKQ